MTNIFIVFGIVIEMKQNNHLDNGEKSERVKITTPFEYVPYIGFQFPNVQEFSLDYDNKLYAD